MTQGAFIRITDSSEKRYYPKKDRVVELSFSNNGNHWTCIDLSRKDLRKLRRTIKKYLQETKQK